MTTPVTEIDILEQIDTLRSAHRSLGQAFGAAVTAGCATQALTDARQRYQHERTRLDAMLAVTASAEWISGDPA